MISVTEIFYAHQAEGGGGAHSVYGQPTVFFRLGVGCTLRCSGFGVPVMKDGKQLKDDKGNLIYGCDSYDSVYPQFKNRATQYSADELIQKYYDTIPKRSYKNRFEPSITISGGEPTLFLDNDLIKFISHFTSRGIKVIMETNGTVMIDFNKGPMRDVMFSVSPKLASNGDPQHKRIKIDALENIVRNAKSCYFKFVVSKDGFDDRSKYGVSEWDEIRMILSGVNSYIENVLFMGMGGVNDKSFHKNEKFAYEKSLELGFQFSPRTHIRLFSDEKYR